jgi:ornithine--oxo-acid transaminase
MANNIADLFAQCERDRFSMHARHVNEQMVRILKTIGYDVGFCRGEGNICTIGRASAISTF